MVCPLPWTPTFRRKRRNGWLRWGGMSLLMILDLFSWWFLTDCNMPRWSMYGIFTSIYHKNHLNVGRYSTHESCGMEKITMKNHHLGVTIWVYLFSSKHLKQIQVDGSRKLVVSQRTGAIWMDGRTGAMIWTDGDLKSRTIHPWSLTARPWKWKPKAWRFFQDDFPFQRGDFQVLAVSFPGCSAWKWWLEDDPASYWGPW